MTTANLYSLASILENIDSPRIDAKSLVDLSIGYGFSNGLSPEASATNLFDNEFRALPGFPKIGRRIIAKVTYNFGE